MESLKKDEVFISEIEISKGFLKKVFEKFHSRISPRRVEVNEMNYFPIPDGDTGNNFSATVHLVIKKIELRNYSSKKDLVEDLQEEILLGSGLGNAGIIFTGWFIGFLTPLKAELVLSSESLAEAFESGENQGYKFVFDPKAGTILDIISVASEVSLSFWSEERNLISLLDKIICQAKISVEKTTEKLDDLLQDKYPLKEIKKLKKQGVVDAGALGFLIFLESFKETVEETIKERGGAVVVIKGEKLDLKLLKERFSPLGDSLNINVSPSGGRLALHIHTDFPEKIFQIAKEFGEIEKFRIEDLTEENF